MIEKIKCSRFDECSCFVYFTTQNKQKKLCRYVCVSACPSGCTYVRMWILGVETITFEGVSGSKQNLVGVFYV